MFSIFFTKRRSWYSVIFLVALLLAALGVLGYKDTNALSLGKIEVLSSIGQPLKAYVQIGSASKEELNALKVNIASPDFFRKAGVKYNPILSSLNFNLVEKSQGFVIEITSKEAIKEPFVDVLLDVSWTGGRLVREYTVLLDVTDIDTTDSVKTAEPEPLLPTKISLDVPANVQPVEVEKTKDVATANVAKSSIDEFKNMTPIAEGERITGFDKPKSEPVVRVAKSSRVDMRGTKDTYIVQSGDSLSKIAAPLARSANVSLEQVIFLLYNDNREQLTKNLDYLEVGTRLKIPSDPSLLQLVPKAEAKRFVLAYSRNFSKYKQSLASVAKTKGESARHNAQSSGRVAEKSSTQVAVANNKPTNNELVLSSPEKIGTNAAGSTKEASPATAKSTQEQEAAIAATSNQVKSDINQAQNNIAQTASVLDGQKASTSSVTNGQLHKKAEPVIIDETQTAVQEPDFVTDLLSNDYVLYGLAALLAIGLVGFAVFNRRKNTANQTQQPIKPTDDPDDDWTPPSFKQNQSTMGEFKSHPSVFAGVGVGTANAASDSFSSAREVISPAQKIDHNAPINLAEVDNLIQYQQFREAEALLMTHLKLKPDSIILKQKLAEIYVALGNKDGFESLLSEFLQSASPDVDWTKLAELQALMDSKQSQNLPKNSPVSAVETQVSNNKTTVNETSQFEPLEAPTLSEGVGEEDNTPELAKTKFDFSSIDLSLDQNGEQAASDKTVPKQSVASKSLDDPLSDSLSTKLELARAYKDIGDISGARQLFQEVASSGKAEFMDRAKAGLESLGSA